MDARLTSRVTRLKIAAKIAQQHTIPRGDRMVSKLALASGSPANLHPHQSQKSEIATRADISLFYFFVSIFADHIANEQVYCEKKIERIYTKEEAEGGESEVL